MSLLFFLFLRWSTAGLLALHYRQKSVTESVRWMDSWKVVKDARIVPVHRCHRRPEGHRDDDFSLKSIALNLGVIARGRAGTVGTGLEATAEGRRRLRKRLLSMSPHEVRFVARKLDIVDFAPFVQVRGRLSNAFHWRPHPPKDHHRSNSSTAPDIGESGAQEKG